MRGENLRDEGADVTAGDDVRFVAEAEHELVEGVGDVLEGGVAVEGRARGEAVAGEGGDDDVELARVEVLEGLKQGEVLGEVARPAVREEQRGGGRVPGEVRDEVKSPLADLRGVVLRTGDVVQALF